MKNVVLNEMIDIRDGILTTTNDTNLKTSEIIEDQYGNRYEIKGAAFPSKPNDLKTLLLKPKRLNKV